MLGLDDTRKRKRDFLFFKPSKKKKKTLRPKIKYKNKEKKGFLSFNKRNIYICNIYIYIYYKDHKIRKKQKTKKEVSILLFSWLQMIHLNRLNSSNPVIVIITYICVYFSNFLSLHIATSKNK